MSDINLDKASYRKKDPKTGHWRFPSDPAFARNYFFVLLAVLVCIFVTREGGSRSTLFGVTAMFSFIAGIFFATWRRGHD